MPAGLGPGRAAPPRARCWPAWSPTGPGTARPRSATDAGRPAVGFLQRWLALPPRFGAATDPRECQTRTPGRPPPCCTPSARLCHDCHLSVVTLNTVDHGSCADKPAVKTAMEEKPAHGSASTAPPDRRHRRTMRTRAAIEKAALRLFAEQGFANTTVEQIAEAADIAPRTFFRHFPSKEAVLYGDSEEAMAQLRQRLAARPADEHPVRSLTAAMLESADQLEEQREQFLQRAELLNSLSSTGN